MLQSLAATEVRDIADSFIGSDAERETLRTALHSVVGCAGSSASGGDCVSGATGAAASVVINNVLTSLLQDDSTETLEGQQARANLVVNLAGLLSESLGGDFQDAALSAQIESENNFLTRSQLEKRQEELEECGGFLACVNSVNDRYALLSANQDLDVAIACQGDELTACSRLRSDQLDFINGSVFKSSLFNRITFGAVGESSIPLDDFLKIDLLRTQSFFGGANFKDGEITVFGSNKFFDKNGITYDRFGPDALDPNSTQARLYDILPNAFAADRATISDTFLGRATDGQRRLVSQSLQGQLNTIEAIAAAEAALGCSIVSAVCGGALTAAAGVDCVKNPSVIGCGGAAIGVAIPVVGKVRGGGAKSVTDDAAKVTDDAPITSEGTANAVSGVKLNSDLVTRELSSIAGQDARLAKALSGSDDFSIGTGSRADADRLGRIFVGDGARPTSNGGLISADGTRVYRPPSNKPNSPRKFAPTGVQANFQTRNPVTGETLSNGHLQITGK